MSNIKLCGGKAATGVQVSSRDEELVCDYLMNKASQCCDSLLMIEVDPQQVCSSSSHEVLSTSILLLGPLGPPKISSDKEDWVLCRVFHKSNREVVTKPSMESCNDDTGSSSLPALLDSYITYEQTQPNLDEHEQVPCFSIFSQNQTSQNLLAPFTTQMEAPNTPAKCTSSFGKVPMDITTPLDSFFL
uniref:NAC domain-containing protein n=1 Tax=Populus alba TaxID=43335 RepID=A0A4V6AA44_POPAL|nr:hypothetical protein D5086_0000096890 [Populus alba]